MLPFGYKKTLLRSVLHMFLKVYYTPSVRTPEFGISLVFIWSNCSSSVAGVCSRRFCSRTRRRFSRWLFNGSAQWLFAHALLILMILCLLCKIDRKLAIVEGGRNLLSLVFRGLIFFLHWKERGGWWMLLKPPSGSVDF